MIKILTLGCILFLASCSIVEKKFDEKTGIIFEKTQKEYCSHSPEHRDLIIDELNERLDRSHLTWTCK